MTPTCETCAFARTIAYAGWAEPKLRCFAKRHDLHFREQEDMGVGADVGFERDTIAEPQRPKGEKCGPEGKNWRPIS